MRTILFSFSSSCRLLVLYQNWLRTSLRVLSFFLLYCFLGFLSFCLIFSLLYRFPDVCAIQWWSSPLPCLPCGGRTLLWTLLPCDCHRSGTHCLCCWGMCLFCTSSLFLSLSLSHEHTRIHTNTLFQRINISSSSLALPRFLGLPDSSCSHHAWVRD